MEEEMELLKAQVEQASAEYEKASKKLGERGTFEDWEAFCKAQIALEIVRRKLLGIRE